MASPAATRERRKPETPVQVEPIAFSDSRQRAISRPKIIDEFGEISKKMDELRLYEKRYEQLRRMILAWHSEVRPTEPADEDGKTYSVHISPCAEQRVIIDMEGLANRLGHKTFWSHCTFSIEKLDSLVLPKDQAPFVRRESVGPRIVKAIPKYQEPAP